MKTLLLFLFLHYLTGPYNPTSGSPVQADSLNRTRPDSTAQADSARPVTPTIQLTGELTLSTGFYATRGLETPQTERTPWVLTGNLTLITRTGWTIPIRLIGSSQNSPYNQPYNQVGISPQYKNWLILHGGYSSVLFSPLTLAGHTFLGAGVELNPGLLRVGAIVGRFSRAVDVTSAGAERFVAFRRMGYGARVGVGNQQNYLDLILLRVADDVQSIQTDSLTQTAPAENLVLGLSGRLRLHKKLAIELDAAGSAYTDDVRAEVVSPAASQTGRFRQLSWLNSGFRARQSTQVYTALQASLSYRISVADLKFRYKRIEPGYTSMGAYYFQTDVENFTAASSLRLFKKRLSLRTSLGWQHDNLLNQKKARNDRVVGSVSASYSSDSNLMFDLAYSNYGHTQRAGYRPLNDTVRIARNNRTLSVNVFKNWTNETILHTVTGSAVYQELADLNPFTVNLTNNQNWNYAASYAYQHLTANLDLNVGYSYTLTKALDLSSAFYGPSVGISKKLLKNKTLSLGLTISYLKSREILTGFNQRGSIATTTLNIDYQLTPVHRLSANWTNVLNRGQQTFHQQEGTIQYSLTF